MGRKTEVLAMFFPLKTPLFYAFYTKKGGFLSRPFSF
jgi:hypothetical protein